MIRMIKKGFISIEAVVIAAVALLGGIAGTSAFLKNGQGAQAKSATAVNETIEMINEEFDFSAVEEENVSPYETPGFYDNNGVLVHAWNDLISVDYQVASTWNQYNQGGQYPIINVDGTSVYTNYDGDGNGSVNYMNHGRLVLPEGIVELKKDAFIYAWFDSIYIPNSVTTIGNYAFYQSNLIHIYIPGSVTTIGKEAFNSLRKNATIYCEAETQPEGWHEDWRKDGKSTVVFGVTYDEYLELIP